MALESHTIVRKLRGGPDGGRFVILTESGGATLFSFKPIGPEMTLEAVSAELIARGICGEDAMKLVAEAIDDFDGQRP